MRILAIETVEMMGSVAALEDARVLVERPLDPKQRSAQSLAPGIAGLLDQIGWRPRDVELVAVATGPGSFTGLRIGVTTAKTFAYAVGCQAIGVHTLASIASRVAFGIRQFVVVLDAHRGELFVADFTRGAGDELSGSETTRVMRLEDWLPTLVPGCVVTGPGLIKVGDRLPEGVIALDPGLSLATAATVGQVGWRTFSAGRRESVFDLLPQYFRRTAAEEQWDRKQLG